MKEFYFLKWTPEIASYFCQIDYSQAVIIVRKSLDKKENGFGRYYYTWQFNQSGVQSIGINGFATKEAALSDFLVKNGFQFAKFIFSGTE